jgi:hypothetical protein
VPNATVNTEATRHDLKSLPGGFVSLRPLPFGKVLERRENASRMSMEQTGRKTGGKIDFSILQSWSRAFDFKECIVDHNLEDANGDLLDFSKATTLKMLDPKVGSEIEALIDDLNAEEDEEDLMALLKPSTGSSEKGMTSNTDGGLSEPEKLPIGSESR